MIGCIFVVSGFEKIITPYQNFQYVIQSYEVVPEVLETPIARIFPWIELFSGVFVLLGLWTRIFLISAMIMTMSFMTIVSQAIIRKLPITECGCFGELVSLPLHVVLMIDATMFCCILLLLKKHQQTISLSLDRYFNG